MRTAWVIARSVAELVVVFLVGSFIGFLACWVALSALRVVLHLPV